MHASQGIRAGQTTASPEIDSNLSHVVTLAGFLGLSAGTALKRVKTDQPSDLNENRAAWFQIRLKNGREGTVHGGFLHLIP